MSDIENDFTLIFEMLRRARQYGLECEVIRDFGYLQSLGKDVEESVRYALYEWDL